MKIIWFHIFVVVENHKKNNGLNKQTNTFEIMIVNKRNNYENKYLYIY